jgi:hypothetical protein
MYAYINIAADDNNPGQPGFRVSGDPLLTVFLSGTCWMPCLSFPRMTRKQRRVAMRFHTCQ